MSEKLSKLYEIRRNDTCWCGSGKKYKKCHMDREKAKKIPLSSIFEEQRKAFAKKMCLHPKAADKECKGNIVKAHTVQRIGLSKIAEKGHVYAFQGDASTFHSNAKEIHILVPRKIGIRNASTFTGFCAKHDNETFSPIEKHDFRFCPEHAFLLGYRSLCRELFAKKATLNMQDLFCTMDSGQPLEIQIQLQRLWRTYLAGAQAGHDDLLKIKTEYDKILEGKDFKRIRYYALIFDSYPEVLCDGGFWPEYNFVGHKIQDITNPDTEGIQFSLIATNKNGAAIFTWLNNKGVSEEFIKSLNSISDKNLPSTILRFVFEYFENTYIKPSWWENLSEATKTKLHHRMEMSDSTFMVHKSNCLIDDGLRVVNWKVIDRRTNSSIV